MAEIVVHGEDFEAGAGDVADECFRLRLAGDCVGSAVEDEDGEFGGGSPLFGDVEFGPFGDVGGVGVEADAAAAIGHGCFDRVGGLVLE